MRLRGQVIVARIVQSKNSSLLDRQGMNGRGGQQLPLILLLRVIAPSIEDMQCCPWTSRTVRQSSVPDMSVQHHHRAGVSYDVNLFRMISETVFQSLIRPHAGSVRSGYDANGAILGTHIVQQQNEIADPVTGGIGNRAHIGVQRLPNVRSR